MHNRFRTEKWSFYKIINLTPGLLIDYVRKVASVLIGKRIETCLYFNLNTDCSVV